MEAPDMRRIVILGKTGSGKSSVANTIFGEDQFTVGHDSISATSSCEAKTQSLNGGQTTLIDTPGFFDTNKPEKKLRPEIVKCITECSPGPHAFLIVLKLERFTELENKIIEQITQNFSEKVFKFATVVFTHGDDLQEGLKVKDYVRSNQYLRALVEKCGGRCHVIDNKYWKNPSDDPYRTNAHQVKEILKSVEEIVNENNGNCYTNDMLLVVEKMTQQEEERIALFSENMSKEEIRQKAKSRVSEFLIKAAGITTGALLGAFFGLAVTVVVAKAIIDLASKLKETLSLLGPEATSVAAAGIAAAGAATVTGATSVAAAGIAAAGAATVTGATSVAAPGTAVIKAGAVGLGVGAAAGATVGAYKGYQAAEESETPLEAIKKTAEAVLSSGEDAMEQVKRISAKYQKELLQ